MFNQIKVPEQTIDSQNPTIKIEFELPLPVITRYPVGKGMFIWNLNNDHAGTVAKLLDLGIKWVAPKIVNGVNPYNSIWTKLFISECRANGIDVWGWGYVYGIGSEGTATANIINNTDVTGYFIDAEGEFDKLGMNTIAQTYINQLKSNTQKPIGLCSYRYPNLHNNFPWKEFLDGCDFHIPQLYWIQATLDTAPSYQLGRSYAQLKSLKDLPYIPVGTIVKDDFSPWTPSVNQIKDFYNGVQQLKCPGYSFYDLDSGLSQLLDTIKGLGV